MALVLSLLAAPAMASVLRARTVVIPVERGLPSVFTSTASSPTLVPTPTPTAGLNPLPAPPPPVQQPSLFASVNHNDAPEHALDNQDPWSPAREVPGSPSGIGRERFEMATILEQTDTFVRVPDPWDGARSLMVAQRPRSAITLDHRDPWTGSD
jgi:hypothetical protein